MDDIFFHANDCPNEDFKSMHEGDTVSFDTADSDKGPKAVNVSLATADAAPAEEAPAEEEAAPVEEEVAEEAAPAEEAPAEEEAAE